MSLQPQAEQQIVESGRLAPIDLVAAKALLRTGPLLGIRENIRAIGEYAELLEVPSPDGKVRSNGSMLQDVINGVPFSTKSSTETGALVSNFFRALESYDGVLDIAAREKRELLPEKEVPLAKAKVDALLAAIAALLATVPEAELARAKAFLAVVEEKSAEEASQVRAGPGERLTLLHSHFLNVLAVSLNKKRRLHVYQCLVVVFSSSRSGTCTSAVSFGRLPQLWARTMHFWCLIG